MATSLKVGKLFGIPLHLHWTLLLIVGWVLYDGYLTGYGMRWDRVGWVGGVIILLFGFVLVHELGHALTARAFGKPTEKILLFPLGGGAYIREQPTKIWQEILVYFGGPMANVLLALLVLPVLIQDPDRWLLLRYYFVPNANAVFSSYWWEDLLCITVGVNAVLAVLNLLPAYPLDGGRILQALLRGPFGTRAATLIVSILGLIAGLGFGLLAWQLNDPVMGAGAIFVAGLAGMEINNGWQRRRLKKYIVADLARASIAERLYRNDSLTFAEKQFSRTGWPVLPVYNKWNDVVGFLPAEVCSTATNKNGSDLITDEFEPRFTSCNMEDNLLNATIRIIEADCYGALIFEKR
ncbi:MAG: M50 family metallopeptidase, partial [Bacteroidota bacterium]